jgi:hypothetical protein
MSSDILLSLDLDHIDVWKADGDICVQYRNAYVKDGIFLAGVFGRGQDFESACTDYLSQIRGKTLVFEIFGQRKEVTVLG